MPEPDLTFVIPTYRLRDVSETVEKYDESFWNSGHSPRITIFDDSTVANHEKYYPLLEKTKTRNDLLYVGPHEKEQFIALVNRRLRDRKLEAAVRNLFRPSYGGNRNFTLIYTLGSYMVSSDDDMRPDGLIEDSPESLVADEISRGKLIKHASGGYEEVANLLKRKIQSSCKHLNDLSIEFGYEGEVTMQDSEEILDRIRAIHERALSCNNETTNDARREALVRFACNLEKAFYGFEPISSSRA